MRPGTALCWGEGCTQAKTDTTETRPDRARRGRTEPDQTGPGYASASAAWITQSHTHRVGRVGSFMVDPGD